ncbi:MAG: MBL fold metallo-hydrolase [Gammaproteobacteria bacterium]|nr:MBL fold metallo-hydrolase [Gammaproteobacteria bacterium]
MQEQVKDSDIFTVDALYTEPQLAAIHLLREGNRIALIDTGTQYSVPQVASALDELGLEFADVELIILTHIHLDHAGGASALMQLCDRAELVVHPKGARHMAHPEKLVAGAIAVYGEQEFAALYGEITPIEASRMITPGEDEEICLGSRVLQFFDSPGHASHHHCIIDRATNSVFTGDTLGIAYPSLRDPDHAFVMPTTTPVQFNPAALHQSINKVMGHQPDWLYYTHYGSLNPSAQNIAGLHEQIEDFILLTGQVAESLGEARLAVGGKFAEELGRAIHNYLMQRARNELSSVNDALIEHWTRLDAYLNAQGLAFWWDHRRQP